MKDAPYPLTPDPRKTSMKFNKTHIALVLSLILNALGGAGVVEPVVGGPAPCPVCPICAP